MKKPIYNEHEREIARVLNRLIDENNYDTLAYIYLTNLAVRVCNEGRYERIE